MTDRSWYIAAINRVDDHIDAHHVGPYGSSSITRMWSCTPVTARAPR